MHNLGEFQTIGKGGLMMFTSGFSTVFGDSIEPNDMLSMVNKANNRTWKRLIQIEEQVIDEGQIFDISNINKFKKENVLKILNELKTKKYEDIANPEDEEDRYLTHNRIFYYDYGKDLLWCLCPLKMALLLKEYDIVEELINMGYPDNPFSDTPSDERSIKGTEYRGSMSYFDNDSCYEEVDEEEFEEEYVEEDEENSDYQSLNAPKSKMRAYLNYEYCNTLDFLSTGNDIPDSLSEKILKTITKTSEKRIEMKMKSMASYMPNFCRNSFDKVNLWEAITCRYEKPTRLGKVDIKHLMHLSKLQGGEILIPWLYDFVCGVEDEEKGLHWIDFNKNNDSQAKKHYHDSLYCQVELVKYYLENKDAFWGLSIGMLLKNNALIANRQAYLSQDLSMYILKNNIEKYKTLLKLTENDKGLYDICYIEAVKNLNELQYYYDINLSKSGVFKDAYDYKEKYREDAEKVIKKYVIFLEERRRDYMGKSPFLSKVKNSFGNVVGRTLFRDDIFSVNLCLMELKRIIRLSKLNKGLNVSNQVLNLIAYFLNEIEKIDADKYPENDKSFFFEDEYKREISLGKERLIESLIEAIYEMNIFPNEKGLKSNDRVIRKILKLSIKNDNQDMVRFLFEEEIFSKKEVEIAKEIAFEEGQIKFLPLLIGLKNA